MNRFREAPPIIDVSPSLGARSTKAEAPAREIMGAYDEFVGILADPKSRTELDELEPADFDTTRTFERPRQISHRFSDGLQALFFDVGEMRRLTRVYGVF